MPEDTVIEQFEDFLAEKYGLVKNMNEAQFMDYMVNVDGYAYEDLVK